MPLLAIAVVGLQVFCAVHALRTGRDGKWLWLIICFPGIGCLLYVLVELIPEALGSRTAARAKTRLVKAVDPQRELRARMLELQSANTTENRLRLAEECMEAGLYSDAAALLEKCLEGLDQDEPAIMELLARAHFEGGEHAAARQVLDDLIQANPEYRSTTKRFRFPTSL